MLVWCGAEYTTIQLSNTPTFETDEFETPAGYQTFLASRISPSRRYLASLVGLGGSYRGKAIWILDLETGDITVKADPASHVEHLAWASDDDQLFATSNSYSQAATAVWRYQVSDKEFGAAVLPFGGGMSLVAVDLSLVDAYIAGSG